MTEPTMPIPRQRDSLSDGRPRHGLRVLVVDDHRAFAEALAAALSHSRRFATVRVAVTSGQALADIATHRVDLLLLDVALGPTSGLQLMDRVLSAHPDLKVIMVSGLDDVDHVVTALARGAVAWVPKGSSFTTLKTAIDEVLHGRTWLPSSLVGPVVQQLLRQASTFEPRRSFVDDLTPRQREVLECLGQGMSRAEIAEWFVLSPHTVRTHIQTILKKAGVHTTLAALALARETGHGLGSIPLATSPSDDRQVAS